MRIPTPISIPAFETLALSLLLAVPPAQGQEIRGAVPVSEATQHTSVGRSLVVVIGIDDYAHWPKLDNARKDASGLQRLLVEDYGFAAPFEPLFDEKATTGSVLGLVQDKLREELTSDDSLVVFFAGHGHNHTKQIGEKKVEIGFLVPVDAHFGTEERFTEFIRVDRFLQSVAELPARHILVILDSCHSGIALGDVQRYRSGARYARDLSTRISRRVVTSARHDQEALDGGPIPGHSLFTGALIDGLRWGGADYDGNGVVTSSEIGLYLQQRVGQASRSRQTPDFGSFQYDERGELVISLQGSEPSALQARGLRALNHGEMAEFASIVRKLVEVAPNNPGAMYLELRRYVLNRDIAGAMTALDKLERIGVKPGLLPLSELDRWELRARLEFYEDLLSMPDSKDLPLDVEFRAGADAETTRTLSKAAIGMLKGYRFEPGSVFRFTLTNRGTKPLYPYLVMTDQDGRVTPSTLGSDVISLAPGESRVSHPFKHFGAPGLEEARFFVSRARAKYLENPPEPRSRAAMRPWDLGDRESMWSKSVFFTTAEGPQ